MVADLLKTSGTQSPTSPTETKISFISKETWRRSVDRSLLQPKLFLLVISLRYRRRKNGTERKDRFFCSRSVQIKKTVRTVVLNDFHQPFVTYSITFNITCTFTCHFETNIERKEASCVWLRCQHNLCRAPKDSLLIIM